MLRAAEVAQANARNGPPVPARSCSSTKPPTPSTPPAAPSSAATGSTACSTHRRWRSGRSWRCAGRPGTRRLPTDRAPGSSSDGRGAELSRADVEEKAERRGRPDDRPAGRADPDRRRWLLGAAARVAAGSLVEVVTEVRDLGPAFDAGVAQRHYFVMFVPVLDSRFTLDVSKRLPLRYSVRKPTAC